jgi:integrase/recombinase XerD
MDNQQPYLNEVTDLDILKSQNLTNRAESVKSDIRKYWDREYINLRINTIDNLCHKMLIQFLWRSGVRITEAISLVKKNIDFDNYMMTVKWLKSRKYHHRVLPMHPELRNMMQIYTATMKADERVFPMSRQRAWQVTKKYLEGHPHQLRHSFAVNWLRCGGDIVILYKILGHAKIQTTMEYLKIVPMDQGKELMKIIF